MAKKDKYYKRPDGLYETIRKINGKRIAFRGRTCAEVDRKMIEFVEKDKKGPLFKDVSDKWYEQHLLHLGCNSLRAYKKPYERTVDYFCNMYIKEITEFDITFFLKDLALKQFSHKTISNHYSIVNMIFTYAIANKYIKTNPCTFIKIPHGKASIARELPSDNDINQIKKLYNTPLGLLHYFVLYTGCRRGEAMAIQYKDIDRSKNLIYIYKSIYYDGCIPKIKDPKSIAGIRKVILLDVLKEKLPEGPPDEFIFFPNGIEYKTTFERHLRKFREEHGIFCTLHQLRHAYATILFEAGIDEKISQIWMGHSSLKMTKELYTHIRNSFLDTSAEKLNSFVSKTQ